MHCTNCGSRLKELQLLVDDEVVGYAVCQDCNLVWLPAEQHKRLQVPLKQGPFQPADVSCPNCENSFLDQLPLETENNLASWSCRKCKGLQLEYSEDLLGHGLNLDSSLFGSFLTNLGLLFRHAQQFKKVNQLPSTFHVEDALATNYKCPHCEAALTHYHVYDKVKSAGGDFEVCDSCFGIWLDRDDHLARKNSDQGVVLEVDFDSIQPSSRVCPKCRDINLFSMRFSQVKTVIDCCPDCFGTWLDGGELHQFCSHLGKDDHDVIDALVENGIFRNPALCKTLKSFSRTLHDLDAQVQEQEKNLEQAHLIQARLIFGNHEPEPLKAHHVHPYEVVSFWQPARTVGGDYFDLIPFTHEERNYLGICIADVSGKGLPAALLMANFQALLRSFASSCPSPAELCNQLNPILYHNTTANKYITVFYAVMDLATHTLTYTNAGHNAPIYHSPEGGFPLRTGGTVLGLFPKWAFTEESQVFGEGDRLLLFTDGISEMEDEQGQDFGEERLATLLADYRQRKGMNIMTKVVRAVREHGKGHFHDDATMLLMARTGH